MNKIETVLAVMMFAVVAFVYGVWYVNNSKAVKACMDNLPVCEAAYYGK
ncbi:MAG: hypothetical protein II453_07035 [Alphaproteobacteria bacterium]|nr:hypothetical protein [Alphaproteobacteria bacterium]